MLTLRYSQLALLARCPKAFEMRYVQNITTPRPSYLVLGSGCHYALAKLYQHKIDRESDMPLPDWLDLFCDAWDNQVFGPEDEDKVIPVIWDEPKNELKDVGISLLKSYRQIVYPPVQPLAVEQSFVRKISDGFSLESRPDLISTGGIVEHKTAKRRKSQEEADRDLQPLCHTVVSGSPDVPYHYHLLLKQKVPTSAVVSTKRSQRDIDWFANEFLPPVIKMVNAGIFPPLGLDSWVCGPDWCSYYFRCRGRT